VDDSKNEKGNVVINSSPLEVGVPICILSV
jgi:hypothetical protein